MPVLKRRSACCMLQGGDGSNIKIQGQGSSAEIYQKDIYACKVRVAAPASSVESGCDMMKGHSACGAWQRTNERYIVCQTVNSA
jgi:hypothetical protein